MPKQALKMEKDCIFMDLYRAYPQDARFLIVWMFFTSFKL
jgi:hypothetical protein